MEKIMILGSGELGRELVISLKRLGQYVIAVDNYDHAPAMQVADEKEVTLLTVTTLDGQVMFCPPIGHRQERGDYMESWQPAQISEDQLKAAQQMAAKVTKELGGAGIWGVEFFMTKNDIYFSELSPRPHDTGMVTLAGTQNLNEFELHARAILGLPIHSIDQVKKGASAVILGSRSGTRPIATGLKEALSIPGSDVRLFGKPSTRLYRRMGVGLYSSNDESEQVIREKAELIASKVVISS